jgi:hypothetical protein
MPAGPIRSTSLTAHLARAAATTAGRPSETVARPDVATDNTAPPADGGDDERCTASVMRGQRCSRPAAAGGLCGGHIAMADTAGPTPRGRR